MATKSASSRPSPGAKSSRPAAPRAGKTAATRKVAAGPEKRRFWLTYPSGQITRPVIWEMSHRFDVVFNVRQASVNDTIGILCLELEAPRDVLRSAIAWLEKQGVKVEPVEINVLES